MIIMIPSVEEYEKANAIVKTYEAEQKRLYELRVEAFRLDLVDYFKNNLIDGIFELKEFELRNGTFSGEIVPINPPMEEYYDGTNNDDIKELCKKHDVKYSFIYWVYHK